MSKLGVRLLRVARLAPEDTLLLFVSLLSAVPRLYYSAIEPIEYDGYWHVFIAMQQDWGDFQREYQANFHPPLFYLLLKVALWFGRTPLVYRAVSLFAGVAAVFVVGKIAGKISGSRYMAAVAALAYGLALPSIVISCEVRSYMLSELFVLVSFCFFLDRTGNGAGAKARVLFGAGAVLACYSHYGAFFYVFACTAVAAVLVLGRRERLLKHAGLELATFVPVAGALSYVFATHAVSHAFPAGHLVPYYFQSGRESTAHFLFRNTHHLFNLFSPVQIRDLPVFGAVLGFLALAGAWTVYLVRDVRQPENARAAITVATTVVMLASLMAAAISGKYPFGGELRHQFLLFPFVVLWGCILLDRMLLALPTRAASVVVAGLVAATAVVSTFALVRYARPKPEIAAPEMSNFRRLFPAPAAVYVDQFNLITFFLHYHDWKWKVADRGEAVAEVFIYDVGRRRDRMLVFRDMARWVMDFADPGLYVALEHAIRARSLPAVTVFHLREGLRGLTIQEESALAHNILELGSAADLCVKRLVLNGASVFGEFRAGRCDSELRPLIRCSQCDDTNWSIAYSGAWALQGGG